MPRPVSRWIAPVVALALLGLAGCELFGPESDAARPHDQVIVIDDLFGPSLPMDPVAVDSAWVAGDSLYLHVGYSGGCADHAFRLYGADELSPLRIYPPQGSVRLSHNANGDACEAYVTEQLRFDLTPVLAAWGQHTDGLAHAMIYIERNQGAVRSVEVTLP